MNNSGDNVEYDMRLTEILLMQELHLNISEIEQMSPERVYEYVIILSELGKIKKEKMEAARNG